MKNSRNLEPHAFIYAHSRNSYCMDFCFLFLKTWDPSLKANPFQLVPVRGWHWCSPCRWTRWHSHEEEGESESQSKSSNPGMKEGDRMGQNLWMGLVSPGNKSSICHAIKCINVFPLIYYLDILGALKISTILALWQVCFWIWTIKRM